MVSRAHPELIKKLFELEVPEINARSIEIKAIAREAGKRTKLAVSTNQEGVDPIGSCVGQRGTRVQSVLAEVGEEKIDIIQWDKEPKSFIEKALSPAKIKKVEIDEKSKTAKIFVEEDQLSLAIGREGQNVRLASKLTGYEIDIQKAEDKKVEKEKIEKTKTDEKDAKKPKTKKTTKKSTKSKKITKKESKAKSPKKSKKE
jgi:N utilization substance protein A